MAIKDKILSYSVASFLDKVNGQNIKCFSIDEAYSFLSNSAKENVKRMMSNMTKRGLLMRLKEGLYYIIPFEQAPETFMPDWHLLSQHLVGAADYYKGKIINRLAIQQNIDTESILSPIYS